MWAEGACESILKPHIPAYTDALERGWRAERDYIQEVCNEYHARISWRLTDEEEPELPLPVYDQFAMPVVEELDDDELQTKRLRVETMNAVSDLIVVDHPVTRALTYFCSQRIGRWLKYRARRLQKPTRMDRSRDPWGVLLAKLAGINSPPKARQAFQQYMHESYEKDIAPVVGTRWTSSCVEDDGTTLRKGSPNAPFRAKVAREMFNELAAEEQAALRRRAQEDA
jgi:hypothetical protein